MDGPVTETWAVDAEWGFRGENRTDFESAWEPVILCLVGLTSGRRLSYWGRDGRLPAFFREHSRDLFISHYSIAELKFLSRLGIELPERWVDTFVEYRRSTNRPSPPKAGLSNALIQLGLPHLVPPIKKQLQQDILHLRFDPQSPTDRQRIQSYCFSDCDGCLALYQHLVSRQPIVTDWTVEYLRAVARMELRGIPMDLLVANLIVRARVSLRKDLIKEVHKTARVFKDETFKKRAFLAWARREGIVWPLKRSPTTGRYYHSTDDETMKAMEGRHPFIADLREVTKSFKSLGLRAIRIDGQRRRHYFSTSVYRTVTGRNAPRDFIFSGEMDAVADCAAESRSRVALRGLRGPGSRDCRRPVARPGPPVGLRVFRCTYVVRYHGWRRPAGCDRGFPS